jgi:uncharacterized membrane protein
VRVKSSVVINRPIGEVFAYAADYRHDPEWRAEVRELRYVSDGAVGPGTQVIETSVLWGRRVVTESVLTAYEPNCRVAFDYVSGPFRVRGSRTFEAVDGGTLVTSELEWYPSRRIARVIAPMMARSYQRTLDRYLARLGTILEGAGDKDA